MQIVAFVILLLCLLIGARPTKWNDAYIDQETTSIVNGLFICVVFMSHFSQYAPDYVNNSVGRFFGQLVVSTFFFYSGCGCALQFNARGAEYLKQFPVNRIGSTLLNFDVAVMLFLLTGMCLGRSFGIKQIALSFICLENVGNSNWYVFIILLCYFCFYAVMWFCEKLNLQKSGIVVGTGIFLTLGIVVIFLSRFMDKFWYDTMMAFGAGVVFGKAKSQIEDFVKRNYWFCLLICILSFSFVPRIPIIKAHHYVAFNLKSVLFAIMVVMATMKLSLNSSILSWFGKHLFPIYIYQRLPMIILFSVFPCTSGNWTCWLVFAVCAIVTCCIAVIYPQMRVSLNERRR